jgi:hypothetical protein
MRQRPLAVAVAALFIAPCAAFDARKFHTAVLGDGPLPLDVFEAKVDRWIASQKGSES